MNTGQPTLRGHHLICLHFFRGEGYTAEFVENLEAVLDALERDCALIVAGGDDVCAACPSLVDGTCTLEPHGEAGIRRLDDLALELLDLAPGEEVDFAQVRHKVQEILGLWRESACDGCDWEGVCGPLQVELTP